MVQGNYIGTDLTGGDQIGNGGDGVDINSGASNNTVNAGNIIAFNTADGVQIGADYSDPSTGNAVQGNSIFSNGYVSIGLGPANTTIGNDSQGHSGPNLLQNYPAITSAQIDSNGDLIVTYADPANNDNSSTFPVTVDFYIADATGQGQRYIASDTLSSDPEGNTTVDLGIAASLGVSLGDSIVATATDGNSNTSEFSPAAAVTGLPSTFTVTNTNDSGAGSLRQAVHEANYAPGSEIDFDPSLTGAIVLTSGELDVTNIMTIVGPGADMLAVSGDNASRVFDISQSVAVAISGLTIEDGNVAAGSGGGVFNSGDLTLTSSIVSTNSSSVSGGGIDNVGTLTLNHSTVSGNNAAKDGGGIMNEQSASLTITDSTIAFNTGMSGAGIYDDSFATLSVASSTISDNTGAGIAKNFDPFTNHTFAIVQDSTIANNLGAAVAAQGSVDFESDTIAGNQGGITFYTTGGIGNTILADNGGANLVYFNFAPNASLPASLGYNLSDDGGDGILTAPNDQTNTNPLLGSLQDNGGPTQTMALSSGSPALGAGDPAQAGASDQRGVPRFAGAVDIGAFQTAGPLLVYSTNDSGDGSLRAAIDYANANGGGAITFASTLAGQTITLTSGELPQITSNVTIDAEGVSNLVVSGSDNFRVFDVASGAAVVITGLAIEDGNANSGSSDPTINQYDGYLGGAVLNLGNLTLTNSTVADSSGGYNGGGIANDGTMTLIDSTVVDNGAENGGGISNDGTMTLINSTVTGNASASHNNGGGIANNGVLTLINSTISDNRSFYGSGIYNSGAGQINITGSTFDDNTSGGGGGYQGAISNQGTVIITGSTFTNNAGSAGAAIDNQGGATLTLTDSTISGSGVGAAINNSGYATLSGDAIINNTAGGINNRGGATLTLTDSTISGNLASDAAINNSGSATLTGDAIVGNLAGGIANSGTLSLTNSTISGNTASGNGGGINNEYIPGFSGYYGPVPASAGVLTVTDSTISGNTAVSGGGVYNAEGATFTLQDTIIVGNVATSADPNINGAVTTDNGFNLIGDVGDASGFVAADLQNSAFDAPGAVLTPLANNGGPTQTMALVAGSPAFAAGVPVAGVTTDQRGLPRGNTVDIGAYQTQPAQFLVTNTSDGGAGSLRAAIDAVNSDANNSTAYPDVIAFDIPTGDPGYSGGFGVWTIHPGSSLPTISAPVNLDGTTQPGFTGKPVIELDGELDGTAGGSGLTITGANVTVTGLVINRFQGDGIDIEGTEATDDSILDDYIGTSVTGNNDFIVPNGGDGVRISGGAFGATIGLAGSGNVISDNDGNGVLITDAGTNGNAVEGNYIGTNYLGASPFGNVEDGVAIVSGASGNSVFGNTIAFNSGTGVQIGNSVSDNAIGNGVRTNSIFGNGSIGIDLGGDGPTANDSQPHTGPNLFQDYPAITNAQIDASGDLLVSFPNPTDPNSFTPVTVDFYLLDANGQGMRYLGSNTTAGGQVSLGIAANIGVTAGDSIVATATDEIGNTSEFSPAVTVTGLPTVFVVTNTNDSEAGSLRQAVHDANFAPGSTITFDPSLTGTIVLTSGELDVTSDMTIDGSGADMLVVSGNNTSRVFDVASGATVSISGLIVESGFAMGNGGDIENQGNLTLTDDTIAYGTAAGVQGLGGGVPQRLHGNTHCRRLDVHRQQRLRRRRSGNRRNHDRHQQHLRDQHSQQFRRRRIQSQRPGGLPR